jgi:hypothetical protein
MGTLTNIFNRLLPQRPVAEPYQAESYRAAPEADIYRLRAVPNEHIHFFVKTIDNAHVRREVDKRSQRNGWKSIGGGGLAAIVMILVLVPVSLGIQAGYKVNALRAERATYLQNIAELELEQARILSPERLEKLARLQDFIDPEPGKVVYLNPRGDASYAMQAKQRNSRE